MALVKKRDNLDGLSDELKTLYAEKDGAFILDLEDDDSSGLKSALEKLKRKEKGWASEKDDLLKQLQEIQDIQGDHSTDDLKLVIQALNQVKQGDALEKLKSGDLQGAMEILGREDKNQIKELTAKLEAAEGAIGELTNSRNDLIVNNAFSNMMAGKENFLGNQEGQATIRADFQKIFKDDMIIGDDGNVYVRDPSDRENILINDKGKVGAADWFDSQVKSRPHYFAASKGPNLGNQTKAGGDEFSLENIPTANKLAAAREATGGN